MQLPTATVRVSDLNPQCFPLPSILLNPEGGLSRVLLDGHRHAPHLTPPKRIPRPLVPSATNPPRLPQFIRASTGINRQRNQASQSQQRFVFRLIFIIIIFACTQDHYQKTNASIIPTRALLARRSPPGCRADADRRQQSPHVVISALITNPNRVRSAVRSNVRNSHKRSRSRHGAIPRGR